METRTKQDVKTIEAIIEKHEYSHSLAKMYYRDLDRQYQRGVRDFMDNGGECSFQDVIELRQQRQAAFDIMNDICSIKTVFSKQNGIYKRG